MTSFTASVTGSSGTPTGSVLFQEASPVASTICSASLASGMGTCSGMLPNSSPTGISITATYFGDATYAISTSTPVTYPSTGVGGATVTIVSPSSNTTLSPGSTMTFTADVTGSSGTPTGAVTFSTTSPVSASICSAALSSGVATCSGTVPVYSGSSTTIMATYSGDATYAGASISAFYPTTGVGIGLGISTWFPQIAIVWPHDVSGNLTPVASSQYINTSIWPSNQVSCTAQPNPAVTLYMGQDNLPVATPQGSAGPPVLIDRTVSGVMFPSLEVNNDRADLADNPSSKFRLIAYSGGVPSSNVWIHAADPRTLFPNPVVPVGFSAANPSQMDSVIQIVFPHDQF
ncbi:MAG TPA: Ig-like domain repeat protein, partial [Chloroflexota bacterium]